MSGDGKIQFCRKGGVATDVAICSEIGASILQNGGNAVDAAVASCFCLGVINSHSSGLGGGGFMIVQDHKTQKSWGYDFREVAPIRCSTDMFCRKDGCIYSSGLSIGVPGELKGLEAAHKAHGRLKWCQVVKPAADLARKGFIITESLANSMITKVDPTKFEGKLRGVFVPGGQALQAGDFIRRPDLADTLDIIAEQGSDALYSGQIADTIIQAVEDAGGILSIEDLQQYKVIERDVIQTEFNGGYVSTMQAPSSGPILLLLINLLEGFNWTAESVSDPKTYHQMIEAFKFAFAHLGDLGDPTFNSTAVNNKLLQIISEEYANTLRSKIDNQSHPAKYYSAKYEPVENSGTTHISVVDADDLAVSLTTSVNLWFGSQIMTSSGIILNNSMADFSNPSLPSLYNLPPNPNNLIIAGKRPLSSMAPTIVSNKNTIMAIGASGGSRIISGVAEVIANVMLLDLNLTPAIDKPRLHHQLYPEFTECEDGVPEDVLSYLKNKGEDIQPYSKIFISIIQAVMKTSNQIYARSDLRKGGKAAICLIRDFCSENCKNTQLTDEVAPI
ncbi:hypothetical protein SNE40_022101 [Patella caerulea]|uniref:Gamma-glutamyltransferase n=1 Tax=Patella caerulea TaxID=87958 RepID=A0AAN8G5H3_PATCE